MREHLARMRAMELKAFILEPRRDLNLVVKVPDYLQLSNADKHSVLDSEAHLLDVQLVPRKYTVPLKLSENRCAVELAAISKGLHALMRLKPLYESTPDVDCGHIWMSFSGFSKDKMTLIVSAFGGEY